MFAPPRCKNTRPQGRGLLNDVRQGSFWSDGADARAMSCSADVARLVYEPARTLRSVGGRWGRQRTKNRCERAAQRNLSRHQKNFFAKTSLTQRLPPFMGQNHFWTGFWERGHG